MFVFIVWLCFLVLLVCVSYVLVSRVSVCVLLGLFFFVCVRSLMTCFHFLFSIKMTCIFVVKATTVEKTFDYFQNECKFTAFQKFTMRKVHVERIKRINGKQPICQYQRKIKR